MRFFAFVVLWAIAFFVALFASGLARAVSAGIAAALQILNLLVFMRMNRTTTAARGLLAQQQGEEEIHFDLVREDARGPRVPNRPVPSLHEEEEEEAEGIV
jgi:hypothetical protein